MLKLKCQVIYFVSSDTMMARCIYLSVLLFLFMNIWKLSLIELTILSPLGGFKKKEKKSKEMGGGHPNYLPILFMILLNDG